MQNAFVAKYELPFPVYEVNSNFVGKWQCTWTTITKSGNTLTTRKSNDKFERSISIKDGQYYFDYMGIFLKETGEYTLTGKNEDSSSSWYDFTFNLDT